MLYSTYAHYLTVPTICSSVNFLLQVQLMLEVH